MAYTEDDFRNNILFWMDNNNGIVPARSDMQNKFGYISSYQFEKYFNTRKWNMILEALGFECGIKIWEENEVQYLIDNYKNKTDKDIAEYLGRTENGVRYKRNDLKLFRQTQKQFWEQWEIDYLKSNFYNTPQEEIELCLYPRKWEAIRSYATKTLQLNRKNHLYKYQLGNGMRICKNCKEILLENENNFFKDKDTFRSFCKKCWAELYYKKAYGENFKRVHYEIYKDLYDINNDKCDSIPEKIITNWLIESGFSFVKHPYYKNYIQNEKTFRKFDWVINANDRLYYVEYFGLWDVNSNSSYLKLYTYRAKKKIKLLYKNGLINNAILIFPHDFKTKPLNQIFSKFIDEKSHSKEVCFQ